MLTDGEGVPSFKVGLSPLRPMSVHVEREVVNRRPDRYRCENVTNSQYGRDVWANYDCSEMVPWKKV